MIERLDIAKFETFNELDAVVSIFQQKLKKEKMKARYRNKLNKIIIELFYEGKWHYIKTLPAPQTLFEKECLEKVSCLEAEKVNNTSKEPEIVRTTFIKRTFEKDTIQPTDEEIEASLKEIEK